MILKCANCGAECVCHSRPKDNLCYCCFTASLQPAESGGEAAQSWEALLGQDDDALKAFCKNLADGLIE